MFYQAEMNISRITRNRIIRFNIIALLFTLMIIVSGCASKSTTTLHSIFYPPAPQTPRLQFLVRYQNSKDLGIGVSGFQKFVTGQSEEINVLGKPHSAIYYKGKLYICDSRRGQVVIMDIILKEMYVLGEQEGVILGKPLSIAIANDGLKYVADNVKKKVFVFDKNDRFIRDFGKEGQFAPTSLAVFEDKLFVADVKDHEVEILNRFTGELQRTFAGSDKAETGVFIMPVNLTIDREGKLYVADLMAGTVHVFDSSLAYVRNIGKIGDGLGAFGRPRGVAVDSAGFVYVADASFENVQVFAPDGELALYFGGPGVEPGNMYLPSGVTISYGDLDVFSEYIDKRFDAKYIVTVANQYGPNGISIYAFGYGKEGYFEDAELQPAAEPADSL